MRYECLECGKEFEDEENKKDIICPICKNDDAKTILKKIPLVDEKDLLKHIKRYQSRICNSSAYLRLLALQLKEEGYYDLAKEVEQISYNRLKMDAMLLDYIGIKKDTRLDFNNIINKLYEDHALSKLIEKSLREKNKDEISNIVYNLVNEEDNSIEALSEIAKKYYYCSF